MSSSALCVKSMRSLCNWTAGHAAHKQPRTAALAKAPGLHTTAGLLAALIVTSTPPAAAIGPDGPVARPETMRIINSISQTSSKVKQDLADMDASQSRNSMIVDHTSLQLGVTSNGQNPGLPEEKFLQIPDVQHSMQGAAAEAANAASVALRSAQEVEQSLETIFTDTKGRVPSYGDVQQALGSALHADLGSDATNAFVGLSGAIIALLGVLAMQVKQRQKSETGLGAQIESLQNVKSKLENRLNNLDQTKVSLEASLTSEKEDKAKVLQRAEELDVLLKETTKRFESKSKEQDLTAANLRDTEEALGKEKIAGAALGEQVIDLSKQVEQQTARAFKAEDISGQLQKELSMREKELKEERQQTSDLDKKVQKLEGTVQQMTKSAQEQAATAQELRESASQAKTAADAAYQRVSTQLQLSMDQAKSLKKTLAQTDAALKKSQDANKKLDEELNRTRAKAEGLQMRLETTASDLKKAHDALEKQQVSNSALKADNAAMQERIKKLSSTLEATTLRLSSEVDVASDMKSQLAELKLEYIAAGDKLEAEQTHIKELQVDLRNMESALNAVSHDKKAAIMENAQLAAQLEGSQKSLLAAEAAQRKTEAELVNTQSTATELQQQLAAFESEMQALIERAQAKDAELEKERADRTAMEAQVDALKRQVVSIEQAERTAREQAQAAVVDLRQEIEAARTRKRAMSKPGGSDSGAAPKLSAISQTSLSKGTSTQVVTEKQTK